MRVSLVFPRTHYVSGDPPLGLAYVAAYARSCIPGLEICILDSTFDRGLGPIKEQLRAFQPDLVGIFVDTLMYKNALEMADCAKKAGAYVVAGGPHATVLPQSLKGACDTVLQGEGEAAFVEIIQTLQVQGPAGRNAEAGKGKALFAVSCAERIQDLDQIPSPAYDLLDMENYLSAWSYLDSVKVGLKGTTMITSRGCPYQCSYCQPTLDLLFGPHLRRRSPLNVIEEIRQLQKTFSIDGIFFHDDTFTINKQWVLEFCRLLKEHSVNILWGCNSRINTVDEEILEAMYAVGLRNIHFGIESGSQRVIDEIYQKKIDLSVVERVLAMTKAKGIYTFGFFMLGAPQETEQEIHQTIDFARRLPLDEASFSIVTPLLGTFLFDQVKKLPEYEVSEDFEDFDYYRRSSIKKGGVAVSRLRYLQMKALVLFYVSPRRIGYILKHFLTVNGLKQLLTKVRRFI